MRKALQGFLRGGLLGGLLGLLGGEVFCVGFVIVIGIWYGYGEETSFLAKTLEFFRSFLSYQFITAIPGLLFGFIIGGFLGFPTVFIWEKISLFWRIVFSVLVASFLHFLLAMIFYINEISFGHINLFEEYLDFVFLIWSIYLLTAILYGYYFPTFKPRWPKFLRKKMKLDGEGGKL